MLQYTSQTNNDKIYIIKKQNQKKRNMYLIIEQLSTYDDMLDNIE